MFISIGLVVLFASCASFEHLTMVREQIFPHAVQCGKCHVEIYNEWLQSDHASAYTNPNFRQATDDYSFEDCLNCHAPEPTVADTPPVARSVDRDEGVTCVSCHLQEGKLSGPIEPTGNVAPHPIGVNPHLYEDSGFCGRCHNGDFDEWRAVKITDKKSCQQCHMPPITRKMTQATGVISKLIVAFEHEVSMKRHTFSMAPSEPQDDIISIEAKRGGSFVTLTIKNNLPHSLPGGDFGFRVLVLQILAIDSKENPIRIGQRELAKEMASAIQPLEAIDWQLKIPPDTVFIRVKLQRLSYEENDIVNLTDIKVPLQ
ncbi:MAG: multiheme c-type cytochrome [Candidatus Brocadiales bacterium]